MAKWTPVVIEGGKSNPAPNVDILEAFERAGFVTESGLFDYEKILANLQERMDEEEASTQPSVIVIVDPDDEQDLRFLF